MYIDARNLVTVEEDDVNGNFEVAWDISQAKLKTILESAYEQQQREGDNAGSFVHLVMTGYVAVNTEGVATTLQRDGSDYSASILGRLLKASAINIWTDVDGVLSADPRRVPQAHVIPEVSYNEAMELAYFGAKVCFVKTHTYIVAVEEAVEKLGEHCSTTCCYLTPLVYVFLLILLSSR